MYKISSEVLEAALKMVDEGASKGVLTALLFLFSFEREEGGKDSRIPAPLGAGWRRNGAKWGIGPAPRAPITSSIFHRHRYRLRIELS